MTIDGSEFHELLSIAGAQGNVITGIATPARPEKEPPSPSMYVFS
jgi:hypothetical protein